MTPRLRESMTHEMLPSTLHIMWPMHQQSLMLLHPKVKVKMYLQESILFDIDLRSRLHEMLPSTLHIMWPMHQQSLMLLHPTVKEKIHLQENALFDIDLRIKVTQNAAKCPLHHVTYAPTEIHLLKKIHYLTFDLVTRNVAQYHIHHVTDSATKFEVATYNGLRLMV